MAINLSQIEKPVSFARAYGATRLIFLEAPWNHRLQLLTQIILLVATMVLSSGLHMDFARSSADEIGLEHLLNHVPLP